MQTHPVSTVPRPLHDVSPSGDFTADLLDLADFRLWRTTGDTTVRDDLVARHRGLGVAMARRYADRGVDHDDLVQVAMIGLVKAVVRFDPDTGNAFSTFAVPTILGELKHHFRDNAWTIKVPRRLQNLRRAAMQAREALEQEDGVPPTVEDVAAVLGRDPREVRVALEAISSCYRPRTLDPRRHADVPDPTTSVEAVACREAEVTHLLSALSARDRRIFILRYYGAMTQQEIAEEMGISQMHVSRLLRKGLDQMRAAA